VNNLTVKTKFEEFRPLRMYRIAWEEIIDNIFGDMGEGKAFFPV
jgi:hypothetical protein